MRITYDQLADLASSLGYDLRPSLEDTYKLEPFRQALEAFECEDLGDVAQQLAFIREDLRSCVYCQG